MISLNTAYSILLQQSLELQTKRVKLFEAFGEVLAQDIEVLRNLPAFSNSAMDGYAVSQIASSYTLQGSIFAGEEKSEDILPQSCIKIMTGAIIPANTLAVIPFEHTKIEENQIIPIHPIKEKQNIKFCAEDYKKGEKLLSKGERLNYASLSLLASQGIDEILVYQTPKIAIFASGNELKEPWEEAKEHQIYNTNAIAYHAILKNFGFSSTYCGILSDCKEELKNAIQAFSAYDVVFTSGGASVGEADFFEEVLKECNADILFHGINLKPGRPMLVAKMQNTLIFSLPGNPLSGALNLLTLAIPTLFKISGNKTYQPLKIEAVLQEDLLLKNKRSNMILGTFDGKYFLPYKGGKYGSGSLVPLISSNAIAIFDEQTDKISHGEKINILTIPYIFNSKETNTFSCF